MSKIQSTKKLENVIKAINKVALKDLPADNQFALRDMLQARKLVQDLIDKK